jgi:hypothetical protein
VSAWPLYRKTLCRQALTGIMLYAGPLGGQEQQPHATPSPKPTPSAADWNEGERKRLPETSGAAIFFDQDSVIPWIAPWGGDQNYTMGLSLRGFGPWVERARFTAPVRGLDWLFRTSKLHDRFRESQGMEYVEDHGLTFGCTAFTPRHLEIAAPIRDDRPYSSLLFLSASRATIDPYGRRMIKTDLTFGMLGLNVAKSVQTSIHTSRRRKHPGSLTPYDPQGWPNQISNGGEPTLKYTAKFLQGLSDSAVHDLTLHTEGSLGYYTNAAAGFAFRLGWLRSEFWTFDSNPNTAANQARGGASTTKRNLANPELFLFAAGRGRAVLYNALLQGQFRDSEVAYDSTQIEHLIVEWEAGVSAGWRGLSLVASVAGRSPEYRVGEPRAHTWGGIYVIWRSTPGGKPSS